jgi:hypothetical protein
MPTEGPDMFDAANYSEAVPRSASAKGFLAASYIRQNRSIAFDYFLTLPMKTGGSVRFIVRFSWCSAKRA